MDTWRARNDNASSSESSEDDESDIIFNKGREALIFVLDATLYETNKHFIEGLKIIRGALLSGLIANDKDLIGIIFANTEHSPHPKEPECLKNVLVPDNCAVFLPLRQMTRDIVDHYLQFFATAENDFGNRFGIATGGEGDFANMIRLCCTLFQQSGFKLSSSVIVYLTDCQTPHKKGSVNYLKSIQKANDLEEQNIEFHLVPMIDDFDYEPFYKEFLSLSSGSELEEFVVPDAKEIRELLCDRKLKQDFTKRCLVNIRWTFGPGVEISIKIYNYFKKKIYPNKVKLLRKDNSIVNVKKVTVVGKLDPETSEILEERLIKPGDGFYQIDVSGTPLKVSTETYQCLKNIHPPGMLVLCFKDKSTLPQNMYFKSCSFIYPDDSIISGSKEFFRVLWERCLVREKIIMCLLISRRKSKPRYVVLVPVSKDDSNPNNYLLPGDGFKLIYLPMKTNYRNIDFSEWNNETSPLEGTKLFRNIIKKLRVKYNPNLIKDPALSFLEAKLLALAFDIPTEGDGKTEMPDPASQDARIVQYVDDIATIFGQDDEVAAKRKAPRTNDNGINPPAKVPKISDDDLRTPSLIRQLIANNVLASLTVKQLRIILEENGIELPKSAAKSVLITRIIEAFQ